MLTERGEPFADGGENVEEDLGLKVGDEHHVVLGQTLQQTVVVLTQLWIVLQQHKTNFCCVHPNTQINLSYRHIL